MVDIQFVFINFDSNILWTHCKLECSVLIAQTVIMEKRHTQMGARTRKFPCKNCIYNHYLDAYTVPILRFLQKTKVGDNLNNQSHLTVYNTKSALATLQLCYPVT